MVYVVREGAAIHSVVGKVFPDCCSDCASMGWCSVHLVTSSSSVVASRSITAGVNVLLVRSLIGSVHAEGRSGDSSIHSYVLFRS